MLFWHPKVRHVGRHKRELAGENSRRLGQAACGHGHFMRGVQLWPKGYRMTRNDSSSSDDVALMASISPDPGHYRSIANPRHSYGSTNEAEPPI